MSGAEYLDRLRQRRDYLTQRIAAKKTVGWETQYDESERDALTWALMQLATTARLAARRAEYDRALRELSESPADYSY